MGGPLYYASYALRRLERSVSVRWPFKAKLRDDNYTIYQVSDHDGVKVLKLKAWSAWGDHVPYCDAALFSPVYHDFPTHILAAAANYKYCVLDVQGLTRYAAGDGTVYKIVQKGRVWSAYGNCIIKIG
jgi:hypothetical protein